MTIADLEAEVGILPVDFGNGWMSKNAADLCRIAVTFGGFEPWPLVKALRLSPGRTVNTRTVERALLQIRGTAR